MAHVVTCQTNNKRSLTNSLERKKIDMSLDCSRFAEAEQILSSGSQSLAARASLTKNFLKAVFALLVAKARLLDTTALERGLKHLARLQRHYFFVRSSFRCLSVAFFGLRAITRSSPAQPPGAEYTTSLSYPVMAAGLSYSFEAAAATDAQGAATQITVQK